MAMRAASIEWTLESDAASFCRLTRTCMHEMRWGHCHRSNNQTHVRVDRVDLSVHRHGSEIPCTHFSVNPFGSELWEQRAQT